MKIISIAIKDLIITFKDRKALALIILMPLVLIFVLGLCLSSMFGNAGYRIKRFDVAITLRDNGEYAKHFVNFLESDEIKKMINLKNMNEAKAMEEVKSGKTAALIVVPEDYSDKVRKGEAVKIKVYEDPGNSLRARIVEGLVSSYAGVASSVEGAIGAAGTLLGEYKVDGNAILPEIMKIANAGGQKITENNVGRKKNLSAMQYYAASMLVMYILFVGMLGIASMIEERENRTLQRLMGTTVSKAAVLGGKLLGLFILGVFDVTILILFTKLFFKVDWGNSIQGIITLSAAMIFGACGFAMMISTIFKTSRSVDTVTPVLIMVMSFIGGSMYPLAGMPQVMQTLSKTMLNNWALRGFLNLMLGDGLKSVVMNSLVLCGFGIVFMILGITRLNLQREQ